MQPTPEEFFCACMLTIGRPSKDIEKVLDQLYELNQLRKPLSVPPAPTETTDDAYSYVKYVRWYFQQERSNETRS